MYILYCRVMLCCVVPDKVDKVDKAIKWLIKMRVNGKIKSSKNETTFFFCN